LTPHSYFVAPLGEEPNVNVAFVRFEVEPSGGPAVITTEGPTTAVVPPVEVEPPVFVVPPVEVEPPVFVVPPVEVEPPVFVVPPVEVEPPVFVVPPSLVVPPFWLPPRFEEPPRVVVPPIEVEPPPPPFVVPPWAVPSPPLAPPFSAVASSLRSRSLAVQLRRATTSAVRVSEDRVRQDSLNLGIGDDSIG
jgi:hypothetical protein